MKGYSPSDSTLQPQDLLVVTAAVQELLGELSVVEDKWAPPELYISGNRAFLSRSPRVSVIGTRKPSELGIRNARRYSSFLAKNRATVVSGLAMGVDTIAHTSAIETGGLTIAVLGTPIGVVTPKANTELQGFIGEHHLLVSQFAPGSRVYPGNFPKRNRTMALISNGTIIIEAGETSGTMSQGIETLRLGRPLFILADVLEAGLSWPQKFLDYGAIVLSEPEDLFEFLPI
ncbi:MAG: DNA-processing protein DprA [bacterium]|nr:DNA-processing protein DprA [bacterium]